MREPDEYQACHIDGVPLLPLSQLAQRHGELNSQKPTYLFCKAGERSLKAVQFLKQHGYENVQSVRGGITAWIETGGPTVKG